jgi:hypothetical protein
MLPNNSQEISSGSYIGVPATDNVPTSQVEQTSISSDIDSTSSDKKADDAERDESIIEEAAGAIVSSKSLFLGILVFMSALFGMGILDNSSCGGSLSFKLFPPELELNRSSCINTERLPQSK